MPRNMSFMLTTQQIKDRTKTVTRRIGWWFLKPGDVIWACEKCMGLKKGEKIKRLELIRVLSTTQECLISITKEDIIKEGFPDMSRDDFVLMFCEHMKCHSGVWVNRIEFEYIT